MKTYQELEKMGIKEHAHSDGKWYPCGTLLYVITKDGVYWTRISADKFKKTEYSH